MDDSGRHENGRQKQTQGQWLMQQQPSMKHIIGIMAERDAAVQERNLAISEKKAALAERDIAILQRDSAIADRNKAIMERDNATSTLQYHENTNSNGTISPRLPGCQIPHGVKHVHHPQQHMQHQPHMVEDPYDTKDVQMADTVPVFPKQAKSRSANKRAKEAKPGAPTKKASKSPKKIKLEAEDMIHGNNENLQERKNAHDIMGALKPDWKNQDLGLNQVIFDETTMPAPVCSCTGVLRQCYKWGNGGWQSSCCTTSLSVYPLPAVPNKRHARVGGRKMSGSAFNKLLSRLAGEGHDLSNPVDLKDNWAKHGTNRYITIK